MTPLDVHWTPEAETDLEEIAYYIAVKEHRPAIAEQIVRGIQAACLEYAANPPSGELEPRIGAACRRFTYKRWVILYKPWKGGIAVLRIVDGSRDFNRLFGAG